MIKCWDKPIHNNLKEVEPEKPRDIIITEYKENVDIEIDENGNLRTISTLEPVRTNLTKKINESAKLLKIQNNLQILEELGLITEEEEE